MRLTLLGTGSPIPDPNRAGPATLVQVAGLNLLFDCGRGVVMRLAGAMSGPAMLHGLFLTHLHSDHVTDLNDIITTRWAMSPVETPLTIVGPPGTDDFVGRTHDMLRTDFGYRIAHHDDLNWEPTSNVTEVLEGPVGLEVLASSGVTVTAGPTDHRPVDPTVGYRIDHDGRSVVIAGDTVPCAGLDALLAGADTYVQTVIRDDIIKQFPMQRFVDVCDYHSSVVDAAQTATRAGVRCLVLTHMVPAPQPDAVDEWINIAAEHFDGEIQAPNDLDGFEIGTGR
jgi:ribonuclease Z